MPHRHYTNHRPTGRALMPEVCPPNYAAWLAALDAQHAAAEHRRTIQLTALLVTTALILIITAAILCH